MVCNNSVAAFKASNIKRHYNTLHAKSCNLVGFSREEKLNELKNKLIFEQNLFTKQITINKKSTKASFRLTQMIINKSQPFSEGEFIKECILEACEVICPEKRHLFADISLSRNIVMRRTEKLSENLKQKLVDLSKEF